MQRYRILQNEQDIRYYPIPKVRYTRQFKQFSIRTCQSIVKEEGKGLDERYSRLRNLTSVEEWRCE